MRLPDFEGLICTILTSRPEPEIAHIHNRMPVILDEAGYDDWLSGEAGIAEVRRIPGEPSVTIRSAARSARSGTTGRI